LVAHCFVEGRTNEKNIINYIDENKLNNDAFVGTTSSILQQNELIKSIYM